MLHKVHFKLVVSKSLNKKTDALLMSFTIRREYNSKLIRKYSRLNQMKDRNRRDDISFKYQNKG